MSRRRNLETVKRGYAALGRGDIEGLADLLADEVEWVMPTIAGIPFTGNCLGRTQVAEFFRALLDAEESLGFTQDDFIAAGSRVAVTGRRRMRVRATNRTVETPYAHFFTVVGGKIHAFAEHYDTAAVADAYRQRGRGAGVVS